MPEADREAEERGARGEEEEDDEDEEDRGVRGECVVRGSARTDRQLTPD